MVITKHFPNSYGKNKHIHYVSIDMTDDNTKEVFGFSLDADMKTIGRVVIDGSNNEKYNKLKQFLSKGVNLFNVYGNNIHIF